MTASSFHETTPSSNPGHTAFAVRDRPTDEDRINLAVLRILESGGVDGAHHKQWVLDQVLRHLLSERGYATFCTEYRGNYDEENEEWEYGEWDEGIAP